MVKWSTATDGLLSNPLTISLLATKLGVPALRPNVIPRSRLLARLEQSLFCPLTLVSAPAGYGKTTLTAAWIRRSGLPAAWLSLDEADDDPARFLSYFIAALQQTHAAIGKDLAASLLAGQVPPRDVILTTLVNDLLQTPGQFLCVLDDFQAIQDKFILEVLDGLIGRQPPHFHLILLTREDPFLPLARLRARNQLIEVRAADLRFFGEEIDRFLKEGMGLSLSQADLATLEERTEGWAVGLQLAGLSMQGRADPSGFVSSLTGEHRFILGYLTEEVLKRQPEDVQEFLLQTSILSSLNGSLCDAVAGQADSAARLESLLAANLFLIPMDDEQRWYRYHHLFADLLRNLLRRAHPEQIPASHLRASGWYEAQNMPAEAVEHALAGQDFARMVRLLESHAWTLLNQSNIRQMAGWLQAIPAEWRTQSPRTNLAFAWIYLLRGNFGQAALYLKQAEAGLAAQESTAQATIAMQAESLALQSNLMQVQGKILESIQAAQSALELADPDDLRVTGLAWLGLGGAYRQQADFSKAVEALQKAIQLSRDSGNQVTEMLATSHLVLMSIQHGRLRLAARAAESALERMEKSTIAPPPIVGAVHGALGLIYYEWNRLEAAREHFQRGIQLAAFSGHNASLVYTQVWLARLLQAQGDLDGADKTIQEAADLFQAGAPGWVRPDLIYRQVCLRLARQDLDGAEAILNHSGVGFQDPISHQTDLIHLAWLRWSIQSGQSGDLFQRLLASTRQGQRDGTTLQALALQALAQTAAGDSRAGLEWLDQALELAVPEGYLRIFIDEGQPMFGLLRLARQRGLRPAAVEEILSLFPAPGRDGKTQSSTPGLVEPLTERELDVLRLLAQGLTYAQIADRLVVSVNTVRFHIKGIYGKFGVTKLAQAIEKARLNNLFH
jgi:LuxR family maltose regulon positive regulatory protein